MDQYKVEWQYIDTLFLRLSKEEFFSIASQIGIQLDEKSTKYEWLSTIQSYFPEGLTFDQIACLDIDRIFVS